MVQETAELNFGPFRLLSQRGPLLRDDREIKLQPKTLLLLWTLVRQAGKVVPRASLMEAVWPGVIVGDEALAYQVQMLRQSLDDDSRLPRYIATVHRVGLRFVAEVRVKASMLVLPSEEVLVGRQAESVRLRKLMEAASRGRRQMIFITGEAGIGKTALIDQVLSDPRLIENGLVARGQCLESFGASEPYLPVLEALTRLCRGTDGMRVIEMLGRVAPTWLMQMPEFLKASELAELQQRTANAPRERMMREMVEALDALSSERPLVLVLEDLHWSDTATIGLLSMMGRRRDSARLLVLCSYRPIDATVSDHPVTALKQDLVLHGCAQEFALQYLDRASVEDFLSRRMTEDGSELDVSELVYRRTAGHPLYMVQMAEYLSREAHAAQSTEQLEHLLPTALHDLIEMQLARLNEADQRLLEAASVEGNEFVTASISSALETRGERVDEICERLSKRGQFIEHRGLSIWPDGTVSGRYGFRHALYEEVLTRRMSESRRASLHRKIAERLERSHGARTSEIALRLAYHFESSGHLEKAVEYHLLAARRAQGRAAPSDALARAEQGLKLLERMPEGAARNGAELPLQLVVADAMNVLSGHGSSDLRAPLERIQKLLAQASDPAQQQHALTLLCAWNLSQGRAERTLDFAAQLTEIGRAQQSTRVECEGLSLQAYALYFVGRHREAEQIGKDVLGLTRTDAFEGWSSISIDPVGLAHIPYSLTGWMLGFPDEALRRANAAVAETRKLGNPYLLGVTQLMCVCIVHLLRRDPQALLAAADEAIIIGEQCGDQAVLTWARKYRGLALCMSGRLDEGLDPLRKAIRQQEQKDWLLLVSSDHAHATEIFLSAGRHKEAKQSLARAFELMDAHGERHWEPELWRVKAQVALTEKKPDFEEAESYLQQALMLSRGNASRSLELRTSTALARLWTEHDKTAEAHALLQSIYAGFSEGFDTVDLRDARTILDRCQPAG